MNLKMAKFAVDVAIVVVFALLVLLYVFLLLGEVGPALVVFFILLAVSLGTLTYNTHYKRTHKIGHDL